jgi:SAM-dependent methyltransferase
MKALQPCLFSAIAAFFYSTRILNLIRELIDPASDLRLLDVPCGTGVLIDICRPCEYHGFDLDLSRIITLQHTLPAKTKVLCASVTDIPYQDASFDRILVSGLFHHVPEDVAEKCLQEFRRILKPGGSLILFDAIWPRWWNVAGWIGRLMDEGKYVRSASWYNKIISTYFLLEKGSYPCRLGLEYILARFIKKGI